MRELAGIGARIPASGEGAQLGGVVGRSPGVRRGPRRRQVGLGAFHPITDGEAAGEGGLERGHAPHAGIGVADRRVCGRRRPSQALVNKILHAPIATLRGHQAQQSEAFFVEAVRQLFRLGGEPPIDEDD